MLVASGFTLTDVHGMTLAQFRAYGEAAETRRKMARTEHMLLLRAAKYKQRHFTDLLKASRTATWLPPG